jgi:hypothetical protein
MNHQASAAGRGQPVNASLQIIDARVLKDWVGLAEVDAVGRDRLASPAAMSAVDRHTAIGDARTKGIGIRSLSPVGQDLEQSRSEPVRQVEIDANIATRKPVRDHRAEWSNG